MKWARRGGQKLDSDLSRVNPRLKKGYRIEKSVGAKVSERNSQERTV